MERSGNFGHTTHASVDGLSRLGISRESPFIISCCNLVTTTVNTVFAVLSSQLPPVHPQRWEQRTGFAGTAEQGRHPGANEQ